MDKHYFIVRRLDVETRSHHMYFERIEDFEDGLLTRSEAEIRLKSKLEEYTADKFSEKNVDYDKFVVYDVRFNEETYNNLSKIAIDIKQRKIRSRVRTIKG